MIVVVGITGAKMFFGLKWINIPKNGVGIV